MARTAGARFATDSSRQRSEPEDLPFTRLELIARALDLHTSGDCLFAAIAVVMGSFLLYDWRREGVLSFVGLGSPLSFVCQIVCAIQSELSKPRSFLKPVMCAVAQ